MKPPEKTKEKKKESIQVVSDVGELFQIAINDVQQRQARIHVEVKTVAERIEGYLELYNDGMEKVNRQAQERNIDETKRSTGVCEWEYAVVGRNDEWKKKQIYLKEGHGDILPKVATAIEYAEDKALRDMLKALLNDYRRMFLHVEFIRDADSCPKFLDDVKVWLAGFNEDEFAPVFTDKRLKHIVEAAQVGMREVKGLQDMVETINNGFVGVASLLESKMTRTMRRTLAADKLGDARIVASLGVGVKSNEQTAMKLQALIKKLEKDTKGMMKNIGDMNKNLEHLAGQIDDMTKMIEGCQQYLEDFNNLPISPVDALNKEMDEEQEPYHREAEKVMDTLYSFLEPFLQADEEETALANEWLSLFKRLTATNNKLQGKVTRMGGVPLNKNEHFETSLVWNNCTTDGLSRMGTMMVSVIDAFQNSTKAMKDLALSRISSEVKMEKEKKQDAPVSRADIDALRFDNVGSSNPSKGVLTVLKMCEKLMNEHLRLVRVRRSRDLQMISMKHKLDSLNLDICLKTIPILKDKPLRKRSSSLKPLQSHKKKSLKSKKGKAKGKQQKSGGSKREQLGDVDEDELDEEEGAGGMGRMGIEEEDEDIDNIEEDESAKGKDEGRKKMGKGTKGTKKKKGKESLLSPAELLSPVERNSFELSRWSSTNLLPNVMSDAYLMQPFRRPSLDAEKKEESVEPETEPQVLKFRFYSQGVPIFQNENGELVNYKGESFTPISDIEPTQYGPRLRARPPFRHAKANMFAPRRMTKIHIGSGDRIKKPQEKNVVTKSTH